MAYAKLNLVYKAGDNSWRYGSADSAHVFGWQEHPLMDFLSKSLGGSSRGTVEISTRQRRGFHRVAMKTRTRGLFDFDDRPNFVVTAPKALKGARFCKDGIKELLDREGSKMVLYFRISRRR